MLAVILADLRNQFGPKVLLDPEDLAPVIGISVGQQANLRSEGRFPIPYEKLGNRIKVSIYDLAQYLAGLANKYAKVEISMSPDKLTRVQKKATKGLLEKNWWAFHRAGVISALRKTHLSEELIRNVVDEKSFKL